MKFAFKWFPAIALVALGLAWVSGQVCSLLGYEVPPQDLVKIFTDPNVPWAMKAKCAVAAVVVCPVVEELVFRGGLFRFVCRKWLKLGFWPAALGTSALFAAAHYFAGGVATLVATFLPLAFLGVAFAWTYEKTGKLHAAMTVHLLFNLLNMTLCLCFPELGQP